MPFMKLRTFVLCLGDVNGDGIVNVDDLFLILGNWGSCF
jgi:hypothetical protein